MRAILSVWLKCSHRCVSLKEPPLKPVLILKQTIKRSTEQTSMRTNGLNIWAAAQIISLNSCQSRFSGAHLVLQVFRDIWPSDKENPSVHWHATLSCPFMSSNYANPYLVPISFWSRSGCWACLWFFYPNLLFRRASCFIVFWTKVAPECFCLVRLKMPLLI